MKYVVYVKSKADCKHRPNISVRMVSKLTHVPKWLEEMDLPVLIDTEENIGCWGASALEKIKTLTQPKVFAKL